MTKLEFAYSGICLGIALFTASGYTAAQQASMATNPSGKPFFKSVTLNNGQTQKMDFTVRAVGSVKGRVFSDAEAVETSESAEPQGIGGVKVSLRSRDAGFENFLIEQFTDESGAYFFQDLRPGKYTIEIDPADLPANLRVSAVVYAPVDREASQGTQVDLSVTAQRSITGIVFIDKDGDGRYKYAKDAPVEGASVTVGGSLAVSDAAGTYTLRGLPAGRTGMLVRWPKTAQSTHVVLDLGTGPVTNRVVNVPMNF